MRRNFVSVGTRLGGSLLSNEVADFDHLRDSVETNNSVQHAPFLET